MCPVCSSVCVCACVELAWALWPEPRVAPAENGWSPEWEVRKGNVKGEASLLRSTKVKAVTPIPLQQRLHTLLSLSLHHLGSHNRGKFRILRVLLLECFIFLNRFTKVCWQGFSCLWASAKCEFLLSRNSDPVFSSCEHAHSFQTGTVLLSRVCLSGVCCCVTV